MSFVLVQVRPIDRDPRWPWVVLSSNSHDLQEETSYATARVYLTNISRSCEEPFFVVFFNSADRPENAYKVAGGIWRELEMKIAPPLPQDPRERFLNPR